MKNIKQTKNTYYHFTSQMRNQKGFVLIIYHKNGKHRRIKRN